MYTYANQSVTIVVLNQNLVWNVLLIINTNCRPWSEMWWLVMGFTVWHQSSGSSIFLRNGFLSYLGVNRARLVSSLSNTTRVGMHSFCLKIECRTMITALLCSCFLSDLSPVIGKITLSSVVVNPYHASHLGAGSDDTQFCVFYGSELLTLRHICTICQENRSRQKDKADENSVDYFWAAWLGSQVWYFYKKQHTCI